MANLIDNTYFINEISLPNLDKRSDFAQTIAKYEKEVLLALLGYDLYKDYLANPSDQKYVDLVQGKEFSFQFEGRTVNTKWEGLQNTAKESLIAYYVYYKVRRQELSLVTGVTQVKGKSENADRVGSIAKMVNAWQRFLELYGETVYSLDRVPLHRVQPLAFFDKYSQTYDTYNDLPSAFNFLNAFRATDYSQWVFSPFYNINTFGI